MSVGGLDVRMKQKTTSSKVQAPKGPPTYRPKQKPVHDIEVSFAADPFDPRFVGKDRRLTPLGILVQQFHYLRSRLIEVAPDAVEFLENQ